MNALIFCTSVILGYLVFGFYVSQMDESVIPTELKLENPPGFYDYRGTFNVQTSRSSGSLSPPDVVSEAKVAGLDFLVLTDRDHTTYSEKSAEEKTTQEKTTQENTGQDKTKNISGYNGNLMVMDETEMPYLDSRLLFIEGPKHEIPDDPQQRNIFITDLLTQEKVSKDDPLVILAYPFNHGMTWSGPFPPGLRGMEILNSKSLSALAWERSKLNVIWSLISYPFNPRFAFLRLFQEPSDELSFWDNTLKTHEVWGFAGADANARAVPLADYFISFPPYSLSLSLMSNHVLIPTELTGDYAQDREKIFSALQAGQFYFSLDLLGNPKGFNAYVQDLDKKWTMGSRIKFRKGLQLKARLPVEPKEFYEIVLLRNGERVATSNKSELTFDATSPGIYRFFVRISVPMPLPDGRKWVSWIFTNPFFLLESGNRP